MKLKSIICNELLVQSRYCDGTDGKTLLDKYADVEFDTYEKWAKLSCIWGCTELPSNLGKLFAYTASRKCSRKLAVEILYRLHYPNLQCAALCWVTDVEVLNCLMEELLKDSSNIVSIFLSLVEVWNWRLNRIVDNVADKDKWMNDEAPNYVSRMYDTVSKLNQSKSFIRWIFSKGYRGWSDLRGVPSNEKKLLYMMEASVLYSWSAEKLDLDFKNLDYLTFVATDIDELHPLTRADAASVLAGFEQFFVTLEVPEVKLPTEKNTIQRMNGFAEMFWKANQMDLLKKVTAWMDKYQTIFEVWKIKGKMHDYRHVQREAFLLSSLLEMSIHRVSDSSQKVQMCDMIIDRLFIQHNCCNDLYLDYYSLPFCIARETAKFISDDALASYDEQLINSHRNLKCVLNIINCSGTIPLSDSNKKQLVKRWQYENKAWEGRLTTINQKSEYNYLLKIVDCFTS